MQDNELIKEADGIKNEIEQIPKGTDKTELFEKLKPILDKLAKIDEPQSDSFLNHVIKKRFDLKGKETESYRKWVKEHRKLEKKSFAHIHRSQSNEIPKAIFDGLVDLVDYEGKVAFLTRSEKGLNVEFKSVREDGQIYRPPKREQIPWELPRVEEIIRYYNAYSEGMSRNEVDAMLYDDLIDYHKGISELPSDEYYDLLTAWDFHTYLIEQFQFTPMMYFFAAPIRGKSRTGKGMIYVANRGIVVESLRDAFIVRIAHNYGASIFFDVKELWRKAEKYGSEDILLHRYEKGAKVPRVLYPEKGPFEDTVYFSTFGPTIIGTNKQADFIFESRSVIINMPDTKKHFENIVTEESALPLRERLLAFRAIHMGQPLPTVARPAFSRLGDILNPLFEIIHLVRPERIEAFQTLVEEFKLERKITKSEGFEAQILKAIKDLRDDVENGKLSNKLITDALNIGRLDGKKLTPRYVSGQLAALGFKKGTTKTGASAILWDDDQIAFFSDEYGLEQSSEPSESSVPSKKRTKIIDSTDGIDDTDGSEKSLFDDYL